MTLTYDFESSVPIAKNASFLQGTTIKNLDEFNAFIHFHSENKNIFMMDDLDDDEKKSNNNNKSKLDAVKTHIRDTKVNDDSFPLILSRRWKTVFIDSLIEFDRINQLKIYLKIEVSLF